MKYCFFEASHNHFCMGTPVPFLYRSWMIKLLWSTWGLLEDTFLYFKGRTHIPVVQKVTFCWLYVLLWGISQLTSPLMEFPWPWILPGTGFPHYYFQAIRVKSQWEVAQRNSSSCQNELDAFQRLLCLQCVWWVAAQRSWLQLFLLLLLATFASCFVHANCFVMRITSFSLVRLLRHFRFVRTNMPLGLWCGSLVVCWAT